MKNSYWGNVNSRVHFRYMGAAWSVSYSGWCFLHQAALNGEPIDLDLTDAREIKRATKGAQELVGLELRYEDSSR